MNKFLLVAALLLTACVEDVGKDKVAAEVKDVPAADEPIVEAPAADAKELTVVAEKSSIRALGAKVSATHPIDFKSFTGTVTVAGDKVTAIGFTADMKAFESDQPKLTEHLMGEDFFDVAKFPEATFKSVSVTDGSTTEGMTHTVEGDLTLRGSTKRVTFPAKIGVNGDEVTANTEFVINRQDFAITYPGKADDLIQDNVAMTIAFVAAPAAAAPTEATPAEGAEPAPAEAAH